MQRHAYELVVVVQTFANGPLDQEAKSSTTAEWSSSTIQSAAVLLSVHVTQCPVSFKGPRSSCQLVFHQWNVSPILCCSSREGMVHLRRGLRPLRYHVLHVRRAHLLTMRATTELPDQHATLE